MARSARRAVDLHQSWAAATNAGSTPLSASYLRMMGLWCVLWQQCRRSTRASWHWSMAIRRVWGYANALNAAGAPNSGIILRWGNGQMLEDVIGWIIDADAAACLPTIAIDNPPGNVGDLVARLKDEVRAKAGSRRIVRATRRLPRLSVQMRRVARERGALLNAVT